VIRMRLSVEREARAIVVDSPFLNYIHADVANLAVQFENDADLLFRAGRSLNRKIDHAVQCPAIDLRCGVPIHQTQGCRLIPRNISHG